MPLISRSLDTANERVSHRWSMAVPAGHCWWGLTHPEALPHWLGKLTSGEFVVGGAVTIQHAEKTISAPAASTSVTRNDF